MTKGPYLSPEVPNPENKGTFFSSTLKIEEKKIPLFFVLENPGLRYGHFFIFLDFGVWFLVFAAWCLISWGVCGTGLGCFPITHLSHEWQRRTYQDLWCVLHHPPFRLAFTGLLGRISWKEDRAEIPLKFWKFPFFGMEQEFVEKLELKPQCVTTIISNPIKD